MYEKDSKKGKSEILVIFEESAVVFFPPYLLLKCSV